MVFNFGSPAPGKEGDQLQPGGKGMFGQEFIPGKPGPDSGLERMSDECGGNAAGLIDPGFERENEEHSLDGFLDCLQPAPPPGPDGRANIIQHWDSRPAQLFGQAQVEIRGIDEQGGGRFSGLNFQLQAAKQSCVMGEPGQYFEDPDRTQLLNREDEFDPRLLHFFPADAKKGTGRPFFAELPDDIGPVFLARAFAGRNEDGLHDFLAGWP